MFAEPVGWLAPGEGVEAEVVRYICCCQPEVVTLDDGVVCGLADQFVLLQ